MTRPRAAWWRISRAAIGAALTALAALAGVGGCDPTEPIALVPDYPDGPDVPLAQEEFCATLAANACATIRPCCAPSPFAFEETKCRVDARAVCESRRTRALGLGYLYDPLRGARCARGVGLLVRDCRKGTQAADPLAASVDAACQVVWHARIPKRFNCPSGNTADCDQDADGMIVCASAQCLPLESLQAGESCSYPYPDRCSSSACQCAPGLTCQGTERRCSASVHALGAVCEHLGKQSDTVSAECGRDRYCDSGGHCAELPGLDAPCTTAALAIDLCRQGYRCDVEHDRTCIEAKTLGTNCSGNAECASGLCALNVCVPNDVSSPQLCDGAIFTDLDPGHGFVATPPFLQGN
jgi:hypothetical protein